MGKKAPTPPDPYQTAAAQTQVNKDTALYNAGLNRINQTTPYGSSKYTYSGVDASGVPQYSQEITLSPLGQQNLDNQQKQDAILSNLGFGLADQAKESLGTSLGNFDDNRQAAQDALYRRQASYLAPQYANMQSDLNVRLANQGIGQGSEAWNRAQDELARQRTFAYQQAQDSAISGGGAEQQRAQALAAQLRTQPLNELNALRSGTQVTNPSIAAPGQSNAQTADLAGLVSNNYNQQLASYNNQVSGAWGALGAGLGALGTAAGGGAFSDRRLKRDIARLGATAAGIPIYAFRYLWSNVRHIGVMAQDVLKVAPEAVITDASGFYAVRYDMVP